MMPEFLWRKEVGGGGKVFVGRGGFRLVYLLRRRRRFSRAVFGACIVFLVWFLLLVVSPFMVPAGTLEDLGGTVGVVDYAVLFSRIPLPWGVVYSVGDWWCHQRMERSFVLGGNEMAFCARCVGMWLGIVLGLLLLGFFRVPSDGRLGVLFLLGVLPVMVDGGGQLVGWWVSTNGVRLVTGLLAGFIGGLGVGILIEEFQDMLFVSREKTDG